MRRSILLTIISVATFAFAACTPEVKPVNNIPAATPAASPAISPVASPSAIPTGSPAADDKTPVTKADALAGRWQGAEGTFLNVTKKGDKFEIEIKNLDPASKKYEGTAKGDLIEFTRDGKAATIKTATGDAAARSMSRSSPKRNSASRSRPMTTCFRLSRPRLTTGCSRSQQKSGSNPVLR